MKTLNVQLCLKAIYIRVSFMNPPEQDVLLGADVQTARLAELPDNIFYDSVP